MGMTTSRKLVTGIKELCDHKFSLAADLGQSQDFTAIAVIEHIKIFHVRYSGAETAVGERFNVRHLQRLPLGLSYVQQVQAVGGLLSRHPLIMGCEFVIDETGVGRPVGDLFNDADMHPTRVTITGGDAASQKGQRRWHVPKSHLISLLDARLHTGELKFASQLSESGTLKEELRDFRRHVSAAGRFSYDARAGKHDDLVLAVALALWAHIGRMKQQPAMIGNYGYGNPAKFN